MIEQDEMNTLFNFCRNNKSFFIPVIFCITGLFMVFYPMILLPDIMPGDLGDARFINYVLEHGYLYINQVDIHKSFWDMPFFYPYKNTLAYSDLLLGGMLVYVPLRFFIDSPQTTFQIWYIAASILNFLSCYLLLTKVFKFKQLSSVAGAFLFAFGLPRQVQVGHAQLYLQFYMMFSLTSFFCIKRENSRLKNNILFLIGTIMFVLQLYTSFYFGWFMVFGAVTALLIGICYPDWRKIIVDKIRLYLTEILCYGSLAVILLIPFLSHYLTVGEKFGWRSEFLLKSYSLFSSRSFIDNLIVHNSFIRNINGEIIAGLGFLSTILILLGFLYSKHRLKILLIIGLILYAFSNYKASILLYDYFPGAVAIRAGGRCIFLILILYSAGLANFLEHQKKYTAIIFTLLVMLEQVQYQTGFHWTKSEHNQNMNKYVIPKNCNVIYYENTTYVEDLDLMWFANNNNIYTSNGYSGYSPPYFKGSIPKECVNTELNKKE